MATEFENYLISSSNLTENSRKTYMTTYRKLQDLLNNDVHQASERAILLAIKKASDKPNTQKLYLTTAIKVFDLYDKKTTRLRTNFDRLIREIKQYTDSKLKEIELPALSALKSHSNNSYKAKDWKTFIITYLLLNYQLRNQDLRLFVTMDNNDLDNEGNFIYLAPSYVRVLINDYKTVKTYGGKKFNIKSTKFWRACVEFLDGDTNGKYLIDEEKASNLSHIVKRHTFDGVGEAIYFKTIVLDHAKNNKIKQLQTLSKNRGTDLSTIVDTYLKE